MSDLTRQRIDISQLDDDILTITFDTNGSIAAQSFLFTVYNRIGVEKFNAPGVISSPGSSTQPGAVTVDLTGKLDSITPETDNFEFCRISASNKQLLAFGDFPIRRSQAAATTF
jgi:hypothetical protein